MDNSIFAGASPWQMWGNTQIVVAPANLFTNPNVHEQQITLLRVQYNRPETWRFLFSARILQAQDAEPTFQSHLSLWFELFTGIGRSAIKIPFWVGLPEYVWIGGGGGAAPLNLVEWTNVAAGSQESFSLTSAPDGTQISQTTAPVFTDTIVGQDMTVVAHVNYTTDRPDATPAQVEVSGQFAPNVHVRPDWFQLDSSPGEQFAGGEVKGR